MKQVGLPRASALTSPNSVTLVCTQKPDGAASPERIRQNCRGQTGREKNRRIKPICQLEGVEIHSLQFRSVVQKRIRCFVEVELTQLRNHFLEASVQTVSCTRLIT